VEEGAAEVVRVAFQEHGPGVKFLDWLVAFSLRE